MSSISYPNAETARLDFQATTMFLALGGTSIPIPLPFIGYTKLGYGASTDGVAVHGASRSTLGQTIGKVTNKDISVTMFKEEFSLLILAIAGPSRLGYMEKFFGLQFAYSVPGRPILYDIFRGVRIVDHSESHSSGGEALMVDVILRPTTASFNGCDPASDIIALATNTLTVVG